MSSPSPPQGQKPRIRTLIVDDEPLALEKLRMLLQRDPEIEIIGECKDGVRAISAIQQNAPDLLFLDIQMPGADGFEVLRKIGVDRIPAVVFVTAYDQHALRAFEFHALDYLLKPFAATRFQQALGRAKTQLQSGDDGEVSRQILSLLDDLHAPEKHFKRLVVKTGGRIMFLRVEEIDWIEASGNYVTLHVASASYLIRQTMNDLEASLNPQQFLRIHRSTIVNIDRVKELQPLFHGDFAMILQNGTRLTLSRNYRNRIPGDLANFL